MNTPVKRERIIELDFLRGIAVFMILVTHYPVLPWFGNFYIALDFFFVLSGFLVAGLLIRDVHENGTANVTRFLIRRGLKIYPAFYFYILFTVVFTLLFRKNGIPLFDIEITARTILAEVFYVQNYFKGIWPHDWSLGLEEQFYILLALLFLALKRSISTVKWLAIISGVIIVIALVLRYHYVVDLHGTDLYPIRMSHLRIDSIFAGVFCSCLYYMNQKKFHAISPRYWLISIFAGLLITIGWSQFIQLRTPLTLVFGYSVFYFGSALLVVGLRMMGSVQDHFWNERFQNRNWVKFIAYIGRHSYSIYLWHVFVLSSVFAIYHSVFKANIWVTMSWQYLIVYSTASIILGIVMAKLIELPILMWRDRKIP